MDFASLAVLYLFVVVAPIVFWLWFFRRLDRREPESGKFLFQIFRFGILAIVAALVIETIIDRTFFPEAIEFMSTYEDVNVDPAVIGLVAMSFFLAGPVEEIVKYLILKKVTFKNPEFNQIADGIIYGTTLALGFVFIENTAYFYDIYTNMSEEFRFTIVLFRGTATTLLHVVSTGILGLYLGRAKFEKDPSNRLALKGVAIASLIHGLFNVFLFLGIGLLMNLLLVVAAAAWLVKEIKKEEFQKIWVVK